MGRRKKILGFEIERNIPAPPPVGRSPIYPFSEMQVSESIVVDYKGRRAAMAWNARNRETGTKLTSRMIGDVGDDRYRIWKVADED